MYATAKQNKGACQKQVKHKKDKKKGGKENEKRNAIASKT